MCDFTNLQNTLVEQGVIEKQKGLTGALVNIGIAQKALAGDVGNLTNEGKKLVETVLRPVQNQFMEQQTNF